MSVGQKNYDILVCHRSCPRVPTFPYYALPGAHTLIWLNRRDTSRIYSQFFPGARVEITGSMSFRSMRDVCGPDPRLRRGTAARSGPGSVRFPPLSALSKIDLEGQQRVEIARWPSRGRTPAICALQPSTASAHGERAPGSVARVPSTAHWQAPGRASIDWQRAGFARPFSGPMLALHGGCFTVFKKI